VRFVNRFLINVVRIVVEELYVNTRAVYCFREMYIFSVINCMSPSTHSEHVVVQLVEGMRYKPEGRGFDSRWCRNFSLT
jgi:hypothetical protein